MRIKFLSFIASFFMVSLFITSCLDNDENVEYSPDATIRAFELDTIGYGIKYKFTIDQISGLIYNEDSLPMHADTIIDRILIKTLTTASGVVTMKDQKGNDSIINLADSIDLRKYVNAPSENKYLELSVYAPDMLLEHRKTYNISIRMHHHDPDSLTWQHRGKIDDFTGPQRSIFFKNNILTYTVIGNALKVYQSPISNMSWSSSTVTAAVGSITTMPTSILSYNDKIYATFKDNANAYVSDNGISWTESTLEDVELFLAPLEKKISYLKRVGDKHIFSTSADGETEDYSIYDIHKEYLNETDREYLPNKVTAYTIYENRNGSEAAMLIGEAAQSTTINDGGTNVPIATPWGYAERTLNVNKLDASGNEVLKQDGSNEKVSITVTSWVAIPAGSSLSYCPELVNPIIIYYNSQFYLFGEGFESFYASPSGRDWKKANKKFSFPYQNWTTGFVPSIEKPEFRGRKNFSVVQDTEKEYIYVLFGKETGVTFTEEVKKGETVNRGPYNHDSEVWRGRLNQLWFDLANSAK